MYKIIFSSFFCLLFFYTLNAYAQTFFSAPQKKVTGTTNISKQLPPVSGKLVSPDEFTRQVSQSVAQEKAKRDQQFNQQLSQKPAPTIPKVPLPEETSEPSAGSPQQSMTSTPVPSTTPGAPMTPAQTYSTTPSVTPAPQSIPPPPPPPPPPVQTQVYTGFPTGAQQPRTNGGQQQTSPKWNIKY